VQEAKILYTTGHFIFSNNDVVKQLGSIANEKNIPFFFNLSAEYTMQFELSKVLQAIEYADFVLCNEHEAKEFAKTQNID
jgi:sugar/nucleoside kinase (ribokinase family)